MSRIGRQKISVPNDVKVSVNKNEVTVIGPKGTLSQKIKPPIEIMVENGKIVVTDKKIDRFSMTLWGLYRSLLNNMIIGVTSGWSKGLELVGVGYRASVTDNKLVLMVGFTNPIEFEIPPGIIITVKGTKITINGIDKQLVGEVGARIRKIRPPEPYKGKGIRYIGEIVRRKAGKAAAKAVGSA